MRISGPVSPSAVGADGPAPAAPASSRPDPSVLAASLEESVHGFALVTTGQDGGDRFLWANPSFLASVRRREAEVVGAPLDAVLPGVTACAPHAPGGPAGPRPLPGPTAVRCTLDDGRQVVAHVRRVGDERRRPLFGLVELEVPAAGHPVATMGADREAGRAELERTNHELDHVTSVIAHDLRQPLAVITAFAHHLRHRRGVADDAAARSLAEDIVSGCTEITTILDNAMAYVQAPPEPGACTVVAAAGAVQAAWWNVQALASQRGGGLEVRSLPLLAFDPVQLRQVFQNLLANALTYVAPGVEPSIVVSASRGPARWIVSVEDNGVGMAPDDSPADGRSPAPRAGGPGHGSGLGLLICRRIVRRHGGRLWIERAPAGGTIVRFEVPDPIGEGN